MNPGKISAVIFLVLMLANFMLFVFNMTKPLVFWFITALCAVAAYWLVPRLNE